MFGLSRQYKPCFQLNTFVAEIKTRFVDLVLTMVSVSGFEINDFWSPAKTCKCASNTCGYYLWKLRTFRPEEQVAIYQWVLELVTLSLKLPKTGNRHVCLEMPDTLQKKFIVLRFSGFGPYKKDWFVLYQVRCLNSNV